MKFCRGEPRVHAFRPGPWALKKSVQSLMDRVPGLHVDIACIRKRAEPSVARAASKQWNEDIEDEELKAGIAFINNHCPTEDADNAQYYCILRHIRKASISPIAGWPEAKVTKMALNKSKGRDGASPQTQFPVHTYSLKPFMCHFLLPKLLALFPSFGVLLLGTIQQTFMEAVSCI